MGISDILSEDMVLAHVEAESKRNMLEQLSKFVAEKENIDENSILTIIGEKKTVKMIAEEQNTIPYEVTTRFSMRLKRKKIYKK